MITFITSLTAFGVAIQQDGKILIACDDDDQGLGALVRLDPDGSLDTSFWGGWVDTYPSRSIAVLPDGKIIASGSGIRRFHPDGSPDASFGNCGGIFAAWLPAVAIQPDGKILAGGAGSNAVRLARCNSDGSPDNTFGIGGIVSTQIDGQGSWQVAASLAIQPDGRILAAGYIYDDGDLNDMFLLRYNSNGSLDQTFDGDGIVATPIRHGLYGNGLVAVRNDGKIVVAGSSHNGTNDDFTLIRYDPSGSLDMTFGGGDGKATVDFNNSEDSPLSMAIDSRGRAVVVGTSNDTFAVARFLLSSAEISGRVLTPGGLGLKNAAVTLTDPAGNRRTVVTSSLGFYSFDDIPAGGRTVTITAVSRRYRFEPVTRTMSESLTNVDVVGIE